MKKYVLLISIALLANTHALAQDYTNTKSLWGSIELGRSWGLSERGGGSTIKSSKGMIMYSNVVRVKAGYYLIPQLSLGAGIGLTRYNYPGSNTLPLVLDLRYHFLPSTPELFAYTDFGKSLTPNSSFTPGLIANVGVAYKVVLGKRTSFNPSIGYNVFSREMLVWGWDTSEIIRFTRHSIFLHIGFEF